LSVAADASFNLANVALHAGSTFSGAGTLNVNGVTTVTAPLMVR
jgi:hypothetical protein